jgi:hypothetical protein
LDRKGMWILEEKAEWVMSRLVFVLSPLKTYSKSHMYTGRAFLQAFWYETEHATTHDERTRIAGMPLFSGTWQHSIINVRIYNKSCHNTSYLPLENKCCRKNKLYRNYIGQRCIGSFHQCRKRAIAVHPTWKLVPTANSNTVGRWRCVIEVEFRAELRLHSFRDRQA